MLNEQEKPQRVFSNFRRGNESIVPKDQISRADALGVSPPKLNAEQKAGLAAEASVIGGRMNSKIQARAQFDRERAEYQQKRDDLIWQKIQSRRQASL